MKLIIAASALSAAVLLSGCGGKDTAAAGTSAKKTQTASVNAGEEKNLFPLTVGNQWVYSVESTFVINGQQRVGKTEATFVVTKTTPTADGTKATIEVRQKDKLMDTQNWEVNSHGIYQVTSGEKQTPYNPVMPAILFPLNDANKQFKWKGSGMQPLGGLGSADLDNFYRGPQDIDTDMGPMSAYCVETKGTFTVKVGKGMQLGSIWWAPKVGMVRYFSRAAVKGVVNTNVLRLKSYIVK
jgi:hypothetical protein